MLCHRLLVELLDFLFAKSSLARRGFHVESELLQTAIGALQNCEPISMQPMFGGESDGAARKKARRVLDSPHGEAAVAAENDTEDQYAGPARTLGNLS